MSMDWNNYQQQALTTAIYPLKRELEYTVLGLCSEVGELGEVYAATKMGRGATREQVESFLSELGDCYWYAAAIADALRCTLQEVANYARDTYGLIGGSGSRGLDILAVVRESSAMAGFVKKAIRDNDGYLKEEARSGIMLSLYKTIWLMDRIADHWGSSRHIVMNKNLNKLADRQKRGVLQGSGDNR